jgi:hypothetical protein
MAMPYGFGNAQWYGAFPRQGFRVSYMPTDIQWEKLLFLIFELPISTPDSTTHHPHGHADVRLSCLRGCGRGF